MRKLHIVLACALLVGSFFQCLPAYGAKINPPAASPKVKRGGPVAPPPAPLAGFSYPSTTVYGSVGASIGSHVPRFSRGTATSYRATSPLPSGVVLNTTTGVVSGMPSSGSSGFYRVSIEARNTVSVARAALQIGVVEPEMKLSSGDDFTCAKLPDGTVKCWGYNDAGQLGQSLQTARSKVPVLVPNLQGVQSIVAGGRHVCVLLIDGRVQCWGDNSHGQLGNGNTTLQTTPVGVSGLTNAVSIAAGADNTCALVKRADPSLELYCWGYNKVCQTGCLENSGGPRENIGLLMDQSFNTPQYIPISIQHQRGQRLPKIVMGNDIDFGAVSICLIPADGSSPRCWGQNHGYQIVDHSQRLVDNANDPSLTLSYQYNSPCWGMAFFPTFLESEEGAVDAAIGQVHACFKRSNSEVVCHGVNSSGQLGVGDRDEHFPVPHRAGQCFPPRPYRAGMTVPADYQFDPVAGVMYIGAPSLPPPPMVTPLPVSGLTSVSKLAAGDYHTCAIKSDGSLWCWGGNGLGQIGDGSRTWAVVPVEINVGGQVSDVDAGMDFTCAVVNGIRVKCWGNGGGGQLGDGQSYYQGSNVPVEVRF